MYSICMIWIQNMLGSKVKRDRPEKNPMYSTTVKNKVKLRATSSLHRPKTTPTSHIRLLEMNN